jgi:hypothetical protein
MLVVREKVLQLQRREGDMRRWFGHLVDDENHDGEELTIDGRWHSCVLAWTAEEVAHHGKT